MSYGRHALMLQSTLLPGIIHLPWWQRQQFLLKCQCISTKSCRITSQKMTIFSHCCGNLPSETRSWPMPWNRQQPWLQELSAAKEENVTFTDFVNMCNVWRRSVGPVMWEIKKYYMQSRRKGISYIQQNEEKLVRLVTSFIGTYLTHYWRKDRGKVRNDGKMRNKT
jgi:hypothetical protein